MFNFTMKTEENYAMFKNEERIVIIDSFDNLNFEVRSGTLEKTAPVATITALSSEELNKKLSVLFN